MKKQLMTLLGAVLVSGSVFAAQATTAKPMHHSMMMSKPAGLKIGVVNVQAIFNHSSAVQETKAKLKKQYESKKKQVEAAAKSLNAMIADYKKNASVMQANDRMSLQKKIAAKQSSILAMESSFQQQAAQAEQEAMAKFVKRIQMVAQNIAKQKHLDLILPEHSLLYSTDKLDLTKQVAAQFNS